MPLRSTPRKTLWRRNYEARALPPPEVTSTAIIPAQRSLRRNMAAARKARITSTPQPDAIWMAPNRATLRRPVIRRSRVATPVLLQDTQPGQRTARRRFAVAPRPRLRIVIHSHDRAMVGLVRAIRCRPPLQARRGRQWFVLGQAIPPYVFQDYEQTTTGPTTSNAEVRTR